MNAGAIIYLAGIKQTIFEGAKLAQEAIENGLVYKKLINLKGIKIEC